MVRISRAIFGGTASKFIFNPQDGESAKILRTIWEKRKFSLIQNLSLLVLREVLAKVPQSNGRKSIC
jgi:hypothetical protein